MRIGEAVASNGLRKRNRTGWRHPPEKTSAWDGAVTFPNSGCQIHAASSMGWTGRIPVFPRRKRGGRNTLWTAGRSFVAADADSASATAIRLRLNVIRFLKITGPLLA